MTSPRRWSGDSPSKVKYDKENFVRVGIAFNRKYDVEAVSKIEELKARGESVSAYVKEAVKEKVIRDSAQKGKE